MSTGLFQPGIAWGSLAGSIPARLHEAFEQERDRWALWLPVALAVGIAIYFGLAAEPELVVGYACLAAAVLLGLAGLGNERPVARILLALLAASLLGFGAAKLRTEWERAPVLQQTLGPITVFGRLESAEAHDTGMRLVLSPVIIPSLAAGQTPTRIRITQRYGRERIVPGTWVHVIAVLSPPPSPSSPGAYDFGRWAYFRQLGAVGYAFGRPKPDASTSKAGAIEHFRAFLQDVRDRMTARIEGVVGGADGAISAALITGEQGAIDADDQNAFRDSGLSHVLSISGLHLALAGGFFFWIVRALLALIPAIALRYPIKKWAAVAALAGATLYLLVSGFGAPAIRSYIMLAVMFVAILFDRPALSMRAVALAAGLILVCAPESLVEPGFQMSFGAVIALIAFAEWESERRRSLRGGGMIFRLLRYGLGIIVTSLIASLATAPFAIYHFDRASLYGLLANLLCIPVVGVVIMPAATVAMVLMPLGLDRIPLLIMGKGVATMLAIATWVSGLPGAASMIATWPLWAVLAISFGGLWICLWTKRMRWAGILAVLAGFAGAVSAKPADILVSRDAETMAIRNEDGKLVFLRRPRDDYTAENWLRRDGDSRDPASAVGSARNGVRCDVSSCIAQLRGGEVVAWIAREDALTEDCSNAAIVVSRVPTHAYCTGPRLVLESEFAARNGAYAITLGPVLHIETAQQSRGNRPWSVVP